MRKIYNSKIRWNFYYYFKLTADSLARNIRNFRGWYCLWTIPFKPEMVQWTFETFFFSIKTVCCHHQLGHSFFSHMKFFEFKISNRRVKEFLKTEKNKIKTKGWWKIPFNRSWIGVDAYVCPMAMKISLTFCLWPNTIYNNKTYWPFK